MPLCIDLFCGLGGWSDGFLAEGWDCIGFDIERHDYGRGTYPGRLVLADVLGLWGSQFAKADCIVASPPCQTYSYMAMPWSRAKALAAWYREHELRQVQLNALFNACFRIQREACAAAGRHIPMVVENVKGAQSWVGTARAHFGSFYFWGDIGMVGNQIVAGDFRRDREDPVSIGVLRCACAQTPSASLNAAVTCGRAMSSAPRTKPKPAKPFPSL